MLTEFILVSENNAKLARMLPQNQIVHYYHSLCVSLISSSWISELQFAHSISPSCGLIVTGIIQALCSLAVQNQVFFTSFCQQKHADAVLGWAT